MRRNEENVNLIKKHKMKLSHYSIKSNHFRCKVHCYLQSWWNEESNDKTTW